MPVLGGEVHFQGASAGRMLDSGHYHQHHHWELTAFPGIYSLYRQVNRNEVKK
jgi:hypothetical protein